MIDGRKVVVAFIVLAVLGAAGFGLYRGYHWALKLPQAMNDAKLSMAAAIEPAVTDLAAKNWDPAAVTRSVSTTWTERARNGDWATALAIFKPYGPVTQFHGVEGFNEAGSNGSWHATATEKATFQGGTAVIEASLSWKDDHWLVDNISLTPTAR